MSYELNTITVRFVLTFDPTKECFIETKGVCMFGENHPKFTTILNALIDEAKGLIESKVQRKVAINSSFVTAEKTKNNYYYLYGCI